MAKTKKEIQRQIDDWQREKVRRYTIKVNREKYPEVIDKLDNGLAFSSRQEYIIGLILKDIHG